MATPLDPEILPATPAPPAEALAAEVIALGSLVRAMADRIDAMQELVTAQGGTIRTLALQSAKHGRGLDQFLEGMEITRLRIDLLTGSPMDTITSGFADDDDGPGFHPFGS